MNSYSKKNFWVLLLFCIPAALFSQTDNFTNLRPSPRFAYEVGFDGNIWNLSQLSPWGIHYRKQFDNNVGMHAQANYIFKDRSTLGLRLAAYASTANYILENEQRTAENVNYYYAAPQFGYIVPLFRRMTFSLTVGAGYLYYQNGGLREATEFKVNSHMLAGNAGLSADWMLTKKTALGCQGSVLTSLISKNQQRMIGEEKSSVNTDKWNSLKIYQIDFSVYLKLYL